MRNDLLASRGRTNQTSAPPLPRLAACAFAAVSIRDRLHNGESETGARAVPSALSAGKAFESVVEELLREAGAFVGDVELDTTVGDGAGEAHLTASVAEGVVDHVRERLLETEPAAMKSRRRLVLGGERASPGLGAPLEAVPD